MSRIGNTPIKLPEDVSITMEGNFVVVKGPKGELRQKLPTKITAKVEGDTLEVICQHLDKKTRALHGLVRALLANQILGVTKGWSKTLELSGVGYRAALEGVNLIMSLGFSHPVAIIPPVGITFGIVEGKIVISGVDKQLVGQVAAKIRQIKKPEPYKGKGIKYLGEYIRRKAGKAAKAIGATAQAAK